MPKPPVDPVDVGLLTASQSVLAREYALGDFARLGDSFAETAGANREGRVHAEFRFHTAVHLSPEASLHGATTSAGTTLPALAGTVRAQPWLVCQRCLNPYEHELESEFRVAFVPTEADTANVPDGYEGVAALHGRAVLAELVEDELLLALPLVPRHATPDDCAAQPERVVPEAVVPEEIVSKQNTQRPFADLRNLLGK